MNLFYSLAFIFAVLGCIYAINRLKHMRSRTYPEAEISWKQSPLSYWRYETISRFTITIHALGLLSLASVLLISLIHVRLFNPLANQGSISSLILLFIAILGTCTTAFISGTVLSYQFLNVWIKPISCGISSEGKFYAGVLTSWQSFSHYEIGPDDGLISLYSSYSPVIRTSVMKPPPELFSRILGIIQQHLPSVPPTDSTTSWQRSPIILIIGMILLVLFALLPAIWGLMQFRSRVWMYVLIVFPLIQDLGIKLLNLFGRGKYPVKKT
jgi:hypothetical protein